MASYRCLVIAPNNPDLPYASDEVMSVVNALEGRLLQGKRATLHGMLDMTGEGWDIVWICSHGDERGIYLQDGVVNASELTTLIRSAGTKLTVLNTCASYPIAKAIFEELRGNLVCTLRAIPDRQAFVTGAVFAKQIANGHDFHDAYELAKPGQNSTYTFFGAKGSVMPPYNNPKATSEAGSEARLNEVVERLDALVNGDPRLRLKGLVDSNKEVVDEVRAMSVRLQKVEDGQRFNRRWVMYLTVVVSIALVALAIVVFFQGAGV